MPRSVRLHRSAPHWRLSLPHPPAAPAPPPAGKWDYVDPFFNVHSFDFSTLCHTNQVDYVLADATGHVRAGARG